jgi:hypothetical protein
VTVKKIDFILEEYKGREEELLSSLYKKHHQQMIQYLRGPPSEPIPLFDVSTDYELYGASPGVASDDDQVVGPNSNDAPTQLYVDDKFVANQPHDGLYKPYLYKYQDTLTRNKFVQVGARVMFVVRLWILT